MSALQATLGQGIPSLPLYQPTQAQQAPMPIMNKQEVIRVDGMEGAYRCDLPMNTGSIIVVDMYKPLAYLITTNGINRNVVAFDIQQHVENNNVSCLQQQSASQATAEDDKLAATLGAINDRLTQMEVTINELKSNDRSFKSGKRNNGSKYEPRPATEPDSTSDSNS